MKPALPNSQSKYYQGNYKPKNPEKYVGDINKIIYRSGWEMRFMYYLDTHPHVLKWASEEISIPYFFDGKVKTYYPDFFIKKINAKGEVSSVIIEIKPAKYTKPPKFDKSKKIGKRQLNEAKLFMKNEAKWKAAKEWCADRKIDFLVLTEKELFNGS
jgi:hypothetical protein